MSRAAVLSLCAITLSAVDVEPAKLATADAAPLDPGVVEVALGGSWTRSGTSFDRSGCACDRGGDTRELGLAIGATLGLFQGLDAGIGIGWTRIADEAADPDHGSGPTDLDLGAKWCCWSGGDDEAACAIALLPAMTLPLGRGQDADAAIPTASRCVTAGLALACSGNLGVLAFNADCGYTGALGSVDQRDGLVGSITADAALGWQVADGLQPEIDLSWSRDRLEDGPAPWALAVTAGVQLGLPVGRLGLGVQRTMAGADSDRATSLLADLAIALP